MFRVLEKAGERMAVHSTGDLEYMQRRGWRPVDLDPPKPAPTSEVSDVTSEVSGVTSETPRAKRKYTKRTK